MVRRDYVNVHLLPRLHALCFDLGYGREAFEYRWKLSSLFRTPFTPENERYRMIFIHIPKTGGMTVLASLFGIERQLGHKPAVAFRHADATRFSEYFKFCVVRNPWDRVVSTFFFLKQGGLDDIDRRWSQRYLADYQDFRSFVQALSNKRLANRILGWKHFLPQSFFVYDKMGNLLVDHVARQERLNDELHLLASRLGVHNTPQRKNTSKRLPYEAYYDDETRAIIMDVYQQDITCFGYAFGGSLASACSAGLTSAPWQT